MDRRSGCRTSIPLSRCDTRCTSTFRSRVTRPSNALRPPWPRAAASSRTRTRRPAGSSPTAPATASASSRGPTVPRSRFSRRRPPRLTRVLTGGGRELPIRRHELVPPCLDVTALTAGQVSGQVFDMHLPPGPVSGELIERRAALLDNQNGLVAVGRQRGLDDILGQFTLGSRRHAKTPRSLAHLHSPGA